ncbi:DNA polymerase III PolC-type [Thalassophryne amazonica]|uniref:DNA polymerase III PolC-type n=1 Tax=Thalassophryne amazonica TaxID=390379 RepID=UPI001471A18E|nr:DNA polymerase III PolC-type [Thalassophryne amazonica]
MSQYTLVFFDLETTGLDIPLCDIVQLAAVCAQREFNAYMVPTRHFSQRASDITGFKVYNGALYRNGHPLTTVSLYEVLSSFIGFLRSFRHPVVLAAHNAKGFDAPVLKRALHQCNLLQDFQQVVHSFLDTYLLSKKLFPFLERYSLESLVAQFIRRAYNSHDAVEDARVLQDLYRTWDPEEHDLLGCTFNIL